MKIEYTPNEHIAEQLKTMLPKIKNEGMTDSDAINLLITVALQTISKPKRRKKYGRSERVF